jgi:hypothetical protein
MLFFTNAAQLCSTSIGPLPLLIALKSKHQTVHLFIIRLITSFSTSVASSDLLLRLGEYDLSNEHEPYPHIERRVQIIAPHPKFDPRTFEFDLALLRFFDPVPLRKNVLPICLPDHNNTYVGEWATVTGWGRLYEGKDINMINQNVTNM